MGRQMLALFQSTGDFEVVAVDKNAVDRPNSDGLSSARYSHISEVLGDVDAIVDFSLHTSTREVVGFATSRRIPLVIATTGHTASEREYIERACESIPVFMASNMSIAIARLKDFAAKLATLFPFADVEIIEAHHSGKLDFPSGTAFSIARNIARQRGFGKIVVGRCGARETGEINVHSLRIGQSLGEHKVVIDTGSERITFCHEVFSRDVYAQGALKALKFILSKDAGLYGIDDLTE